MRILVFNCGSSSLKFALFDLAGIQARRVMSGELEEIGAKTAKLRVGRDGQERVDASGAADHTEAARAVVRELKKQAHEPPQVIAHRVVHGGPDVVEPAVLDEAVLRQLKAASRFAPLHNPPALETIRAAIDAFPALPQVVVTDTAFHRTLPLAARTYALPWDLAERHEIRRYGFHGIGHAWMLQRYAELSGRPAETLNLITLQLGAGCSACAIRGGRSVDTSMGMTPLEGLMMATRSGDLDPGIFPYLAEREGLAPRELESVLNDQAGLVGISGISGDMRAIEAASAQGSVRSRLAIEMFCARARKYIGAYMTIPGKVAAIIFGGGIGEHAPAVRSEICDGLEHLGIAVDLEANRELVSKEGRFSGQQSGIELWVVPLEEELYIARAAAVLLQGSQSTSAE